MKILKIVMCILVALSMVGCVYTEGDNEAEASFNLMTSQEKAMHDKAMEMFGEKRLMSVRTSVAKRKVRPNESSMPFMDIANVIKHSDESILVPTDARNDTDGQEKARRVKFSSQDFDWYKKIVKRATGKDYTEPIKPVSSKPMSVDEVKDEFDKKLERAKERVEVNQDDLLSTDDYSEVQFLATGCERAKSIVESAASQNRPLTVEDFQNIEYESAVCKTKELNDNL